MTQQETRDRIIGRMRGVIRCIKDGQYIEDAIIDGLYEVGVEIADEISAKDAKIADLRRRVEALPVLSVPSCWPAYAPITAPGTLTTTAKEGDPLVWFGSVDERTFAQALESALTEHADVWQALADRDAGKEV